MTLHTLSSGSQGNCLLLSDGDTHILVDAGISTRRIKAGLAQLELSMDELDGILITHEHTDHISGLATLIKHHSIPLYASPGTARQLAYRLAGVEPLLRPREPGCQFEVGQCLVTAFETSHDAAQSMDYRIDGSGSVGILTDTGYVTDEAAQVLPGVSLLVLESNHDVEYLRSGPYPEAADSGQSGPPVQRRCRGLCGTDGRRRHPMHRPGPPEPGEQHAPAGVRHRAPCAGRLRRIGGAAGGSPGRVKPRL